MNAARLLGHYEKIADAPDAIMRLRRFILDLAVRGTLVWQDPKDEPASELLKKIAAKNAAMPRSGKKQSATVDDLPFTLPGSWCAASIAQVLDELQTGPFGSSLHQSDYKVGGTPVINPASIQDEKIVPIEKMAVGPDTLRRLATFKLQANDIIMGRRGEMGRCAVVSEREQGWLCGTGSLILRPSHSIFPRFLVLLIGSPFSRKYLSGTAVGSTMQNLNQSILLSLVFGLPPFAEQQRIVAKVDELMALCDQLEKSRAAREEARDRLTTASLARLNDPDPETFHADGCTVLDALPALTARPDQVKQLRQTILNLAVRGKLVPQDPKDEPAIQFDLNIPIDLEPPFPIAAGWKWSRLKALGRLVGGGTPSKARDDFWNGSIPWVSPKDMKVDYIAEAKMSITDAAVAGSAVQLVEPESVLFVVRGMILAHSFPVAISRARLTINQDMKALVLKEPAMAEYLLRALKGLKPEILARVQLSTHGTCRIEGSDYGDFLIPTPPVAEQKRIVAKVDELMSLCDRLETTLTAGEKARSHLLDALLHEALEPVSGGLEEAA